MFFVKEKDFYKKFFYLVGILAMQNLVIFSVSLFENVLIGSYSEISLAAIAITNQLQYMVQMICNGVGEGIVVLSSQYWGKRDIATIRKIIAVCVKFGFGLSFILFMAGLFFPHETLGLLTSDVTVIDEGVRYLQIACFSYIPFVFTSMMIAAQRSVENVRIGFLITCSTLVLNLSLNYCLISGRLGFPALGITGAAITLLICRIVEASLMVYYLKKRDQRIRIRFKSWLKTDALLLKDYVRIGVPVLLCSGVWGFSSLVQTAIFGHLPSSVIAATSVATALFQVITVIPFASASSASVIIGKAIGEGKTFDDLKLYARTIQILFFGIGLLSGFLYYIAKPLILPLYDLTGDTLLLAQSFMAIINITIIGTSYQAPVIGGIVRGGGDTKFGFWADTLCMWLFTIPIGYLSAYVFHWPPEWTFFLMRVDQLFKGIIAFIKVNRMGWIRHLTRAELSPNTTEDS